MVVHQHNAVLLPRLLGLRDYSPFVLVQDTVAQTANYFILELLHQIPQKTNVIFVSFETLDVPTRANQVVEIEGRDLRTVYSTVPQKVMPLLDQRAKNLVIIDTFAYVPSDKLTQLVMSLFHSTTTIVGVYHTSLPDTQPSKPVSSGPSTGPNAYYPSALNLLHYLATSSISIFPDNRSRSTNDQEDHEKEIKRVLLPLGYNHAVFEVVLAHRRRSGRTIQAQYVVSYSDHSIEYIVEKERRPQEEDESMLENLTTFNLGTTDKQREAKDKVDLPFLQAQEFGDGGAKGGAIIYQFEKDDDYDEEDPYEDPF